ncbi:hypothetical protein M0802_016646 [Mischocyttarus mexicanus]|nr:hypothetical protein M0802_016646 [Mischocyttarus mexicanus]
MILVVDCLRFAGRLPTAETSVSHVELVPKSGRCSHLRLTPPSTTKLHSVVGKECADAALLHVCMNLSHGKKRMC